MEVHTDSVCCVEFTCFLDDLLGVTGVITTGGGAGNFRHDDGILSAESTKLFTLI